MLKYRINTKNFLNNDNKVNLKKIEIKELYGNYVDNSYETTNFNRIRTPYELLIVCYSDNVEGINNNKQLLTQTLLHLNGDSRQPNGYVYEFMNNITVNSVQKNNNLFTFKCNKYFELDCRSVIYSNTDNCFYFNFNQSHYCDVKNDNFGLYIEYNDNGKKVVEKILTEYVDNNHLRIKELSTNLISLLFSNDLTKISIASNVKILRNQFFYNDIDNLNIFYDKPVQILQLPLTQKFETNLFQSDGLQTEFVEKEKEKAINKINDLEKDVYIPVFHNNGKIEPLYEIKFNLHFREHRGDEWLVENESFWNGTYMDGKTLKLMDNTDSVEDKKPFFSYASNINDFNFNDKYSYQSDLLSYLNFTNLDVRYQKNKLKKSFLRLSFYDSVNPANQNLLYYSTIFMDSGNYFTKYVKYIEDAPYSMITYDDEGNIISIKGNMECIRVNREPMKELINNHIDELKEVNLEFDAYKILNTMNAIEDLRLSSQFVVKDKYNSNSSSEGYYIYLWKDNFLGLKPQDLYMKVEFNHAGYGRTIPFMMPFLDKNKGEGTGIKSFEQIVGDWNDDKKKYGIRKYTKYSYIHFKYRYDNDSKQHIYYLDDDFYGTNYYHNDNSLIINLYEAKMI